MATFILALILAFGASPAFAQTPGGPTDSRDVLFQVSVIDALLAGVYDGMAPMSRVLAHGDLGLGTLDGLDGELIIIDGAAFVVRVDGFATPVPGTTTTPFAVSTPFDADLTIRLGRINSMDQMKKVLTASLPSKNMFCALRARGRFSRVKTRSVPRQAKPYPPLAQVAKNQSVFGFEDVDGALVGFYCPPFVKGVNVPGWHLHFITRDRTAGGHVLDLEFSGLTVELDPSTGFLMHLPGPESDFHRADLAADRAKALHKVESGN